MITPGLDENELRRYARQVALADIGEEGQLKLKHGKVLVIGAGGLGSPVLLYLAAAGVGTIGIADGDCVDESNLQRQVIHDDNSVGVSKVRSAAARVKALNPYVEVREYATMLDEENMAGIVCDYDFVVDATDSLRIKFLIDRVCTQLQKSYSHGAIWQYEGQTMTVVPGSFTYSQLFPDEVQPSSSDDAVAGPFGAVAGLIGCVQAAEAVKSLTGVGHLLTDRLLRVDVRSMKFTEIRLR